VRSVRSENCVRTRMVRYSLAAHAALAHRRHARAGARTAGFFF
jgi:hypothetical protein